MTREGNGFKTHEDMVRLDRLKDLGEGNFISNTVKKKSIVLLANVVTHLIM